MNKRGYQLTVLLFYICENVVNVESTRILSCGSLCSTYNLLSRVKSNVSKYVNVVTVLCAHRH